MDILHVGLDVGSTTVKIAILDDEGQIIFSAYERHFANIQDTLASLLLKAKKQTGIPIVTEIMDASHIDLFDDVYITYVCHTQRHHRQHFLQLDISNARGFKMAIEGLIFSNRSIV